MTDTTKQPPETVLVPVVGHVRMPLLSREERAEFIASLEEESANIKRGQFTVFDKESFIASMMQGYRDFAKNK
jgi:hypothetical protein